MTQVLAQRRPGAPIPRPARAWLMVSLLALVPGCYRGDFFDRLVDPDATAAFRIVQLTLVDPHTYSGDMLACQDSTKEFNTNIASSIAKFDTNTTLVLRPLDPAVDRDTLLDIVPAACVPGASIVNCTDKDVAAASIITAGFNNIGGGTCLAPVAGSLNPLYMGGTYEPLHAPRSPCFVSAMIPSLGLDLTPVLQLPLSNVQIAAAYQLDGVSQKLVQGVIRGFLPSSVAKSSLGSPGAPFIPWNVLAGGGSCNQDTSDIDTVTTPNDGVWMYFNFTAERVAWASEATQEPGATSTMTASVGATDTTDATGMTGMTGMTDATGATGTTGTTGTTGMTTTGMTTTAGL